MVMVGTLLGLAADWPGMRTLAGLFSSVANTSASNPVALGLRCCGVAWRWFRAIFRLGRSARIEPAVALRQE
jgi:hypothetical protein